MELVPWRPFQEVGSLRREMHSMWKYFFGETIAPGLKTDEWMPSVDITEAGDHIVVAVELPGFEPEDVDVRVAGDLLILKGEKKKEEVDPEHQYYCREINSETFQRAFLLPADVEGETARAVLKNGVLRMSLPKTIATERKEIRIKIQS